jgi:hypothetical protein
MTVFDCFDDDYLDPSEIVPETGRRVILVGEG